MNESRISLLPLIAGTLGCVAFGGLLGLAIAMAAGWSSDHSGWGPIQIAAAAVGCWTFATLIGLLLTSLISGQVVRRLPLGILVGSATRTGVAVMDGLIVSLMFKPELNSFWIAFLLSGLLCLIFEVSWSMLAIRRFSVGSAVVGVA